MPDIKRKAYEVKAAEIAENTIRGAAAVMGNLDCYNEVIFPGFFKPVLKDFLANGFVAVGHDWWDLPVAIPVSAKEVGSDLVTEAQFHSTQAGQDARTVCVERIGAGKSVGLSVGFMPDYETGCIRFDTGTALLTYAGANGYDLTLFDEKGLKAHKRPCWGLTKCEQLFEYSIVPVPANPAARATEAKGAVPGTVREFEAFLREAGYSKSQACRIASHGFDGAGRGEPDQAADATRVAALRAQLLTLRLTEVTR